MTAVFVAGAGGRVLLPLLVAAGNEMTGTTRSRERAALIERQGARAVVVDVFDRERLTDAAVARARRACAGCGWSFRAASRR